MVESRSITNSATQAGGIANVMTMEMERPILAKQGLTGIRGRSDLSRAKAR
jgi:hypothetical protein